MTMVIIPWYYPHKRAQIEQRPEILGLPSLARSHDLKNYDAAYLGLANKFKLPLGTNDSESEPSINAAVSSARSIMASWLL